MRLLHFLPLARSKRLKNLATTNKIWHPYPRMTCVNTPVFPYVGPNTWTLPYRNTFDQSQQVTASFPFPASTLEILELFFLLWPGHDKASLWADWRLEVNDVSWTDIRRLFAPDQQDGNWLLVSKHISRFVSFACDLDYNTFLLGEETVVAVVVVVVAVAVIIELDHFVCCKYNS